ncbi:uncharacterized protein TNCV_4308191 [Trichonephila clavipes]|nr:uncharacterized protein TNCV_4308191 [Trichonephila clavipes]
MNGLVTNILIILFQKVDNGLKILEYIAGKDWGADAVILRNTNMALIRPILEYGFLVYGCASVTNLDKLEKIQLSAAIIITGLRRSCPREIVLLEADLPPLRDRRGLTSPNTSINSLANIVKLHYILTGTIIRD